MANLEAVQEDNKLDMTPMIDCVFLLMIFFVLVIDLSQQDLEDLILPQARFCVADESAPRVRPIVNITQDGDIIHRQNIYYEASKHGENYDGIGTLLREWRSRPDLELRPRRPGEPLSETNPLVPDDPVLIRGDKWVEWHYIGRFMKECSQPYAGFWKLELAMSEVDEEGRRIQAAATNRQ